VRFLKLTFSDVIVTCRNRSRTALLRQGSGAHFPKSNVHLLIRRKHECVMLCGFTSCSVLCALITAFQSIKPCCSEDLLHLKQLDYLQGLSMCFTRSFFNSIEQAQTALQETVLADRIAEREHVCPVLGGLSDKAQTIGVSWWLCFTQRGGWRCSVGRALSTVRSNPDPSHP
jgi:hypothetical protein